MVLESHAKLCMTDWIFLENDFCPQKWGNGPKEAKNKVFQFIGKFGH